LLGSKILINFVVFFVFQTFSVEHKYIL
jgi:hypothetical protein